LIRSCVIFGEKLYSGSYDDTIKTWQVGTWENTGTIRTPYPVHETAISDDGIHLMVTNSNDRDSFIWELFDQEEDWDEELLTESSVNFPSIISGNDRVFVLEQEINDMKTKFEYDLKKIREESKNRELKFEKGNFWLCEVVVTHYQKLIIWNK
jgi:WD40 repeat protein